MPPSISSHSYYTRHMYMYQIISDWQEDWEVATDNELALRWFMLYDWQEDWEVATDSV